MMNGNLAFQQQIFPTIIKYPSRNPLTANSWIKASMGQYRSNGKIKDKKDFILLIRTRNLNAFIDDFSQKSSMNNSMNPHKNWGSKKGSSLPMGNPEANLTPSACGDGDSLKSLPEVSSFSEYPSLMAARKDKPCLLIGYDSEWENLESGREMLSWQYALGCILDHLDKYKAVDVRTIRRYKYCAEWKNHKPVEFITDDLQVAHNNCKYVFRSDIGFTHEIIQEMPDRFTKRGDRDWAWFHTYLDFSIVESIKVCIVCHAGKVDLSALSYGKKNLLRYLTDIQGGLASLQPVRYAPRSMQNVNNTSVYPVSLSIADTMCHAPAGKKKLKDLGKVLGIEKVDIDSAQKERMKGLLINNLALYMEYASTDSVITVFCLCHVWI